MKLKIIYLIFISLIISCYSCTQSVRSNNNKNNSKTNDLLSPINNQNKATNKNNSKSTIIKDTTFIYLSKSPISNNSSPIADKNLDDIYQNALNKFNNNDYAIAAEEFKTYTDAIKTKTAKYYQAMFYYAESTRQDNSTAGAIEIINRFINDKSVPADVVQPTLVLLGQCYCDINQNKKANEAFDRLRREYPDSKYIKIANCN